VVLVVIVQTLLATQGTTGLQLNMIKGEVLLFKTLSVGTRKGMMIVSSVKRKPIGKNLHHLLPLRG
jgi:hypothetical protein